MWNNYKTFSTTLVTYFWPPWIKKNASRPLMSLEVTRPDHLSPIVGKFASLGICCDVKY